MVQTVLVVQGVRDFLGGPEHLLHHHHLLCHPEREERGRGRERERREGEIERES